MNQHLQHRTITIATLSIIFSIIHDSNSRGEIKYRTDYPQEISKCQTQQPHCSSCYQQKIGAVEYCNSCNEGYLLDISQKPYTCIACPTQCGSDCTPGEGCGSCIKGYFQTKIESQNIFHTQIYICKKCDSECGDCEGHPLNCIECPEYYKLENKKCKFAYFELIYLGIAVILIVLIVLIVLMIKCICMEKAPEKPNFGTILDKDPELQSDHIKYEINTIGAGTDNESFISVVEATGNDDYLSVSQYSQDPIISQLLGPPNDNPKRNSEIGDMYGRNEDLDSLNQRILDQRKYRNNTVYRN